MIPGLEMFVVQGRKIAAFEHLWSIIVRMALKSHLLGSPVIKSITIVTAKVLARNTRSNRA